MTKPQLQEKALLSLKVLDNACGSGHILLSAARRIGLELARVRESRDSKTVVEQPSPPYIRQATRDAIRYCIYGVDLNPLAVELCKVALWLEAHNPGEPLNFLDHHIKCGNAIVGLAHKEELKIGIADEAFKTLPGDEKEIAQSFSKRNKAERKISEQNLVQLDVFFNKEVEEPLSRIMETWERVNQMPENSPVEIEAKQSAYNNLISGSRWWKLKTIADMQVAQFFIPKTTANKDCLVTDADYRQYLSSHKKLQDLASAKAVAMAQEKHFFHWFLEFPEVFVTSGFDLDVGNPPFLGGLRISKNYGNNYLNYLQFHYPYCKGTCDFVAYFFRRNFNVVNANGFVSLISTNTITQGDTREGSLDVIQQNGGKINFAIKSIQWPGKASVSVSIITFTRRENIDFFIGNIKVEQINSFIEDGKKTIPFPLITNQNKSYKGCTPLGKGFVLKKNEAEILLKNDKNKEIIKPYLIGDDLNNNCDQSFGRYIINFGNLSLEVASLYPECLKIVEERVRPEREQNSYSKTAKEKWWLFERNRPDLYTSLEGKKEAIVSCTVTKFLSFTYLPSNWIFDVGTNVITRIDKWCFSIYQSSIHEIWARKYGSSLESRLRYTNEDCIENYPFPQNISSEYASKIDRIGNIFPKFRKQLMLKIQLGLTKTYNLFHSPKLALTNPQDMGLNDKSFEKKFGKDAQLLRKHLSKNTKPDLFSEDVPEQKCSFNEAVEGIIKLRELHVEMDNAVLEAYGWAFDSPQSPAIQLRHDFYEVDYLPENDRIRYTIHPDARKEVLKRLLELNHKIHEEEVKAGLWDKKGSKTVAKKKDEFGSEKVKSTKTKSNQIDFQDLLDFWD